MKRLFTLIVLLALVSGCAGAPRAVSLADNSEAAAVLHVDLSKDLSVLYVNDEKLFVPFSGPVNQVTFNSGPTIVRARWMQSSSAGGLFSPTFTYSRFQCFDISFEAEPGSEYDLDALVDHSNNKIVMWIKQRGAKGRIFRGRLADTESCETPLLMGAPKVKR
jgi:hypothetical protein